ncbi:MAG: ABC transporter ATP-binding protein [Sphingomonas bacterium]
MEINAATKRYGDVVALDAVDLSIRAGEFLTLLGPSGSGKSTLLMLLAGFESPDSGEVVINGRVMNRVPANRRDQGIVFQRYALFPHLTVSQNLAYPLQLRGVPRAEIAIRVGEALERVRMEAFGARFPNEMSGGQQQRVALARAIVHSPPMLLMDESLSALDRNLRTQMQLELVDLHRDLGTTIVYVTHDQGEALTMSDRVAVLRDGRLVQLSTPHDLYTAPENRFVAQFTGDANLLPAEVRSQSGADVALVDDGGREWRVPSARQWATGERVTIVARPESLTLLRHDDGGDADALRMAGSVERIVFFGSYYRYEIRTGAGVLIATRSGGGANPFREGEAVTVSIDARNVSLIRD